MNKTYFSNTAFLFLLFSGSVSAQSIIGTYYSLRFYPDMANAAYVHTNIMYKGLEVSDGQQFTFYKQEDFGLDFQNDAQDTGTLKKIADGQVSEGGEGQSNLCINIYQMDSKDGDREILHIPELDLIILRTTMPGGFSIDAAYVKVEHPKQSFAQYCKSVLSYHLLRYAHSDMSVYSSTLQKKLKSRRTDIREILTRIEGKSNVEAKRIFAEYPHGFFQISFIGQSLLM